MLIENLILYALLGDEAVQKYIRSRQKKIEKRIPIVPLYSGPERVFAIPPFCANGNTTL